MTSSRLDEFLADHPMRLSVPEVADLLGVTTQGVYKWIHAGVIPAYKLGSSWLILRDELRDAIASGSNLAQHLPGEDSEDRPAGG